MWEPVTRIELLACIVLLVVVYWSCRGSQKKRQWFGEAYIRKPQISYEVTYAVQPHWEAICSSALGVEVDYHDLRALGAFAEWLDADDDADRRCKISEDAKTRISNEFIRDQPFFKYEELTYQSLFHHTSGVRQIWSHVRRGPVETEDEEIRIWPMLVSIDPEPVIGTFEAICPRFGQLMAKGGAREHLIKWLAPANSYLLVRPGGISFAHPDHPVIMGEKNETRSLSKVPAWDIEAFLVFLEETIPGGSGYEVRKFPDRITEQMEKHNVTYFDSAHHHDVDSESRYYSGRDEKSDLAERFKKETAPKLVDFLTRKGFSLTDNVVEMHWFSTDYHSTGIKLRVFQ